MKTSEVFQEAANLLEEGGGIKTCCDAIGFAQNVHWRTETKAKTLFTKLFKPEDSFECDLWMGHYNDDKCREHRIWAMLFMAEITKNMK